MNSHILQVYKRNDINLSHGKGSYLYSDNGNKYLDFTSGIGVNCLGHANEDLVSALTNQAGKIWHLSNLFNIPGLEEYADQLTSKSFADKVFFCNSGAEAVECCIKMVRRYHDYVGNPKKYKIITFTGAFHGRTLAAIWASKRDPMMQEGFGPPVEGFVNVEFEDIEAVKNAIDDETAGILIETIQGDGGIRPTDHNFLKELRKICDEKDLLLCLDEIQCGMGRTGNLWAYEQVGIEPDILTSAKGIGGGFPLGACLATDKVANAMTLGTHGSTYGGNPLAMAVAKKVLEIITEEEFLDNVKKLSLILRESLYDLQSRYSNVIEEVRGVGLILGIKLKPDNKEFANKLIEEGLILPPAADNVLRLLPSLNITESEISEACEIIEKVCRKY